MKRVSLIITLAFVFFTSIPAFAAVSWTNLPNADPAGPTASDTISQIVADFQTSSGVTLSAATDAVGSLYGVAAGHVVSGTRIYTSHSNNAQIDFIQLATTTVIDTAIATEAGVQLTASGAVAQEQSQE